MGSWGSGGVRTEEMNIGGIPPCGHTLATHRGLPLAWGVYPLLCRDTEDYRIPPSVSRHRRGYTPRMGGIPPAVSRHSRLSYTPCCVATHRGYTPHARGIPPPVSRHRRLSYTPCCVATHRGVYPSCEGYTPSCVATQRIIPPLLYAPLCRDTWGVYPPHDTGLITRLCQADISTTRHTTPAQE